MNSSETNSKEKTDCGQPQEKDSDQTPEKKTRSKGWIIAGIVLVAAAAAVLILALTGHAYIGSIKELHQVPELEKTFYDAVSAAGDFDYDRFMTFFHPDIESTGESDDMKDEMKGLQEDFQDAELRLKGLQVESVEYRDDDDGCRELEQDILKKYGRELHITRTAVIRFTVSYETNHDTGKEEIVVPFMLTEGKWYIEPDWRAQ